MIIRRQRKPYGSNPAVINVTQRPVQRRDACVVGIVVPFQVVEGTSYSCPGPWPIQGVEPVVFRLPRPDRCEGIIGIEYLDRAVHIPLRRGTIGCGKDSAVLVNADNVAGRPRSAGLNDGVGPISIGK